MPVTHPSPLPRERQSRTATEFAVSEIRQLLTAGHLVPGAPIRQAALADVIGMSRSPVRAALQVLAGDGVVTYTPNAGYRVAQLTASELTEVYLMRECFETALAEHIAGLPPGGLDYLTNLNSQIEAAGNELDILSMKQLNKELHFYIFGLAGLDIVTAEVRRLWSLVDPYHSRYLYEHTARNRIIREHDEIIGALDSADIPALIQAMRTHRENTKKALNEVFAAEAHNARPVTSI